MNENLDLTQILRVGDKIYSTILGKCIVEAVDAATNYPIKVITSNNFLNHSKEGKIYNSGVLVLFVSFKRPTRLV